MLLILRQYFGVTEDSRFVIYPQATYRLEKASDSDVQKQEGWSLEGAGSSSSVSSLGAHKFFLDRMEDDGGGLNTAESSLAAGSPFSAAKWATEDTSYIGVTTSTVDDPADNQSTGEIFFQPLHASTPSRRQSSQPFESPEMLPMKVRSYDKSNLSNVILDVHNRLVKNHSGRLLIKRPDFLVGKDGITILIIEDKIEDGKGAAHQVVSYMSDFVGEHSRVIAIAIVLKNNGHLKATAFQALKISGKVYNLGGGLYRKDQNEDDFHWMNVPSPEFQSIFIRRAAGIDEEDPEGLVDDEDSIL